MKRKAASIGVTVVANPRMRLLNYEELLLESMINFGHMHTVTPYATLFNSVLSNLSQGLCDQYYKSGVQIGRALYKLCEARKKYSWYEESVSDLVNFFEKAGYKRITYNVFPDKIEITLHHGCGMRLGANVHVFESGIMSGFLTAGRRGLIHMKEVLCTDNGAEFCRFVSSSNYDRCETDPQVSGRFFEYLREHLDTGGMQHTGRDGVPEEYYLLSSLAFMNREYAGEIKDIMRHMGNRLSNVVDVTKSSAEKLVEILGFGELEIGKLRPLSGTVVYHGLRARQEFVNMSIAFIDGLLAERIGKKAVIEVTATAKANRYSVRLTERKTTSKR
jgi:predicted hydrocarbon binding protein